MSRLTKDRTRFRAKLATFLGIIILSWVAFFAFLSVTWWLLAVIFEWLFG